MTEGLQLHQMQALPALNRNPFRPYFEDPKVEAAWMVERLDTFHRVNQRALWFMLLTSLLFVGVDLVVLGSSFDLLLMRTLFVFYTLVFLIVVSKVRNVNMGDWLVLLGGTGAIALMWFHIFLELPMKMVEDYWMVTAALLDVVVFVLIETTLLMRLTMALLVLVMTVGTPIGTGNTAQEIVLSIMHVGLVAFVGWVAAWQVEVARRLAFVRQEDVEKARTRTVALLRNILPVPIADRLLSQPGTIAERHSDVTVLFADIVGFTPWASSCEADEVVGVLDEIFSAFDELCDLHSVEKIKTIGDAYMAAGGVPSGEGGATASVVRLALAMMDVVAGVPVQQSTTLQLRIGVHQGPVVAGVIGRRKFIYDLWGDTVNTAARMESHGVPGRVQVTEEVANQLGDDFVIEPRGIIEVKGKGAMNAYLVGLVGQS